MERVTGKTGMAVLLCSTADGNELPAPWPQVAIHGREDGIMWETDGQSVWIEAGGNKYLLAVVMDPSNAAKVTAAPEMLDKLIEVHAYLIDGVGESEVADEIAALIAKAQGGTV